MRNTARMSASIAAASALATLVACGGGAPELVSISYQVNLAPSDASNKAIERLSLLAYAKDPDGAADFDVMYVLHDASEQYWTISGKNLVVREEAGAFWVGAENIQMADASPIPRGRYRIILKDRSGESAETELAIGAPDTRTIKPPEFKIENGDYTFSSTFARNVLLLRDASGTTVAAVELASKSGTMESLTGIPNWRDVYSQATAYGFDARLNVGAFSWTVDITP
jgi:hypothetical protein